MLTTPWAYDWYHAPDIREEPNRSTGFQVLAPDPAAYAVL